MRYRKRFGRWGEAAVARALRDRGYEVRTAEGMNRIPGRDIIAIKGGRELDVQVKATARKIPADAFQLDWTIVRDYVDWAKELNRTLAMAVANPRRRAIYWFTGKKMDAQAKDAERGIGDHYSRPGRIDFEYEEADAIWDLTPAETAEGLRIAEDDSDSGTNDLFLLE